MKKIIFVAFLAIIFLLSSIGYAQAPGTTAAKSTPKKELVKDNQVPKKDMHKAMRDVHKAKRDKMKAKKEMKKAKKELKKAKKERKEEKIPK